MMRFHKTLGHANDPGMADRLLELSHHGSVEYLQIPHTQLGRRRLRLTTDQGTDCAIALPRDHQLHDGAVLLMHQDRAIVVRAGEQRWLRLRPIDEGTALKLGYLAGNMHWHVRFEGTELQIALQGPENTYLDRLKEFLSHGTVRCVDDI